MVLADIVTQDLLQFFIEHHDERIHIGFEFGQTSFGVGHATTTFPIERLGHHTHGEDAHFARHTRHHRSRTRACATAHACCDEDHVGTFQHFADGVDGGFCGGLATLGLAASAQTVVTQLNGAIG